MKQEAPALVDTMIVQDIYPDQAHRGNALESLELSPLGAWWKQGQKLVQHAEAQPPTTETAASKPASQQSSASPYANRASEMGFGNQFSNVPQHARNRL